MKLDELMKKYGLLLDEEGRYYRINAQGNREEPFAAYTWIAKLLGLTNTAVYYKIKANRIVGVPIIAAGRPREGYNINQIIRLCQSLTENLPLIEAKGTITIKGKVYASISQMSKIFGSTFFSVNKKIEQNQLMPIEVRTKSGIRVKVYDVELTRRLCADLLDELPGINQEGIVIIDSKEFASVHRIAQILDLSFCTVADKIEQANLTHCLAKSNINRTLKVYEIELAKHHCKDLIDKRPVIDDAGVATIKGKKFASCYTMSKILGVTGNTIAKRLKEKGVIPVLAKTQSNKKTFVYDIEMTRELCAYLDKKIFVKGTTLIKGRRFTSIFGMSKIFGISREYITKVVEQNKLIPFTVKLKGKDTKFYDVEQTKKLCADYIKIKTTNPAKT